MKKVAIGCLVVLVLAAVALAVGGYFVYRAASPMLEDARAYLSRLSELDDIDRQVATTTSYVAPPTGELTEAQVQRFARVQDAVRTALGQRFNEIEAKYRHLKGTADGEKQPSITEIFGALGELANVFVEARRYQVAALNQEKFSQAEYSWVRDRVFQAAGREIVRGVDFNKLRDAIRSGTGIVDIRAPELPVATVPEKNRALVKPYISKMDEWLPLAFFGL